MNSSYFETVFFCHSVILVDDFKRNIYHYIWFQIVIKFMFCCFVRICFGYIILRGILHASCILCYDLPNFISITTECGFEYFLKGWTVSVLANWVTIWGHCCSTSESLSGYMAFLLDTHQGTFLKLETLLQMWTHRWLALLEFIELDSWLPIFLVS